MRVIIDPAAGVRVSYKLLVGDPFPRVSVGAGPFNNSDSANPAGSNHSVDASLVGNTAADGSVGPVWYVDGNGLELQRHAFSWRPFYNGASLVYAAIVHSSQRFLDAPSRCAFITLAHVTSCPLLCGVQARTSILPTPCRASTWASPLEYSWVRELRVGLSACSMSCAR